MKEILHEKAWKDIGKTFIQIYMSMLGLIKFLWNYLEICVNPISNTKGLIRSPADIKKSFFRSNEVKEST